MLAYSKSMLMHHCVLMAAQAVPMLRHSGIGVGVIEYSVSVTSAPTVGRGISIFRHATRCGVYAFNIVTPIILRCRGNSLAHVSSRICTATAGAGLCGTTTRVCRGGCPAAVAAGRLTPAPCRTGLSGGATTACGFGVGAKAVEGYLCIYKIDNPHIGWDEEPQYGALLR